MRLLREQARDSVRKGAPVSGADISPRMIETAKQNALDAGCDIEMHVADVTRMRSLPAGVTVTNPPYGERLHADAALDWLDEMIDGFSQQTDAKTLGVLVPADLRFCAGPTRYQPLHNGDIDCELRVYEAGGVPSKMRTPRRRGVRGER
jgi:23S rRNA G2445 N2-methylase RlmL